MSNFTAALSRLNNRIFRRGATPALLPPGATPVAVSPAPPEREALAPRNAAEAAIATSWTQRHVASTAITLAIRKSPASGIVTRTFSTTDASPSARAGLVLDAVAALIHDPDLHGLTIELSIDDRQLLAELLNAADAFATLVFQPRWQRHRRVVEAAVHGLPTPPALIIATDASILPGVAGAGIAAVAENGRVVARYLAFEKQTLLAELQGISLALQSFPGPLEIRCDSAAAVALANGQAEGVVGQLGFELRRVTRLRAGRRVNVIWVQGHASDPLNTRADQEANRIRVERQRSAETANAA